MSDHLVEPHGGTLIDLIVDEATAQDLKKSSVEWPSWDLTPRQLCDLELMMTGAFSPLTGFLGKADYESVLSSMRLADNTLWPMPIMLDVPQEIAADLSSGSMLALRDEEGVMVATLEVSDAWQPDKAVEARAVFGTEDPEHPGVDYLMNKADDWYVGGTVRGLQLPVHYDFRRLRSTPARLREQFIEMGWSKVVAFQTRNPMHRAHVELTMRAAADIEASLLIHPVVGLTKPGDIDHYTRVRAYQSVLDRYPKYTATLSLLNLAMRMAGPREAVWHAIIRKNHGCSHLIVGRDHAGPGSDSTGEPFYGPYDAQELLAEHEDELGVGMVPFRMMVYVADRDGYSPVDEVPEGAQTMSISGTELRERLADGRPLPEWFTFPEVAAELQLTHRPRAQQGITIFFTGLSGSGKSTVANVLQVMLLEMGGRSVTLLDGDIVRKNLSSELGFSKEHRDLNVQRIGFVAAEIAKAGGLAICAPIAPYDSSRKIVRSAVEAVGGFILVHMATPLEVCEQRDRKGLYAKARAGIIPEFTGISDPYEEPADAEVVIDTSDRSPEEAAMAVILYLEHEGYLAGRSD